MLITRHGGVVVRHDVAADERLTLEAEVAAAAPAADVIVRRVLHVLLATARTLDHQSSRARVHCERLLDATVLLWRQKQSHDYCVLIHVHA